MLDRTYMFYFVVRLCFSCAISNNTFQAAFLQQILFFIENKYNWMGYQFQTSEITRFGWLGSLFLNFFRNHSSMTWLIDKKNSQSELVNEIGFDLLVTLYDFYSSF